MLLWLRSCVRVRVALLWSQCVTAQTSTLTGLTGEWRCSIMPVGAGLHAPARRDPRVQQQRRHVHVQSSSWKQAWSCWTEALGLWFCSGVDIIQPLEGGSLSTSLPKTPKVTWRRPLHVSQRQPQLKKALKEPRLHEPPPRSGTEVGHW